MPAASKHSYSYHRYFTKIACCKFEINRNTSDIADCYSNYDVHCCMQAKTKTKI